VQAFGRYEIVRRIGVGGMGEVYYAYAYGVARTKKPVVVKVLRGEMLSEPGAPEMFVEEGRLSLGLSHSNILQVFDFGKADDRYFMAMEYVDGLHLGELRKKSGGKLPAEVAAFVCMEVCLGLDYAHRLKDDQGQPLHIVHRDVTPSNILISREGEVKLADFGIARAVGRSQHTQAGQIRGKVRYMSPEAARGEPLDHRTDLFSLGAIFFELLTGRRAFDAKGGREKILQQIVSTRAPAPSEIAGTHPALDAIVLTATAPKRDDRFPDAFAMHRAIEEACQAASLRPSRGAFLGFLRELESRPPVEGPSWHSGSTRPPKVEPAPEPKVTKPEPPPVSPSGKVRQPVPSTPSGKVRQPVPTSGSGKVRSPDAPPPGNSGKVPRSPAAAMTPATPATPTAPTQAPDVSRSRPGVPWPSANDLPPGPTVTGAVRPSSVVGAVPPDIKDPDSHNETALKTGVGAPPVLFTLTMQERDRESGGAVAHFEVTRFEPTPALDKALAGTVFDDDADEPGDARAKSEPVAMIEDDTPGAGSAATIPPIDAASGLAGGEVIRIGERSVSRRIGPPRNGSGPEPVDPADDAPTKGRMGPAPVSTAPAGPERESLPSAETVLVPRDGMNPPGDDAPSHSSSIRSPAPGHTDDLHSSGEPVAEQEVSERWRVRKELTGERSIEPGSNSDSNLYPAMAPPRSSNPAYYWLAGLALAGMVVIGLALAKLGGGPSVTTDTPRETPFVLTVPTTARPVPTPTRAFVVVTPTPAPTRVAIATPPPTPRPTATPRPTHAATPTVRVVQTPAPSGTGLVDINSDPWSEVRVGSRLLGNTPLREIRLPLGRQVLSLRNPRTGKVKTVEIDVQSGQNRPVLVNLN
jgi:serine/threonine protein kinase